MRVDIAALFFLATMVLSGWLTRRFCEPGSILYVLDHPNERSLHSRPTPRTGGIAIITGIFAVGALMLLYFGETDGRLGWLAAGVLVVAVTSFVDDHRHLSPIYRIVAHILAAVLLTSGGFELDVSLLPGLAALSGVVTKIITVLYVVWMLNLYNFMDGMDGFAGGMSVIGFGTVALLATIGGAPLLAGLGLAIAGAALGFLRFNFPPAKIFMGDVGSSTLGLLAAALSLWGARDNVFPFWVAVLIFSPFIVDATVTLLHRALRGMKVWEAHKTHYYQRLVQAGWGHRKTVMWEYGLMVACAGSAVWATRQTVVVQWVVIVAWMAIYFALSRAVGRLENSQR